MLYLKLLRAASTEQRKEEIRKHSDRRVLCTLHLDEMPNIEQRELKSRLEIMGIACISKHESRAHHVMGK